MARSPRASAGLRRQLVQQLETAGVITTPAVRAAFLAVPRERFLPEALERDGLESIYRDRAILTRRDARGMGTSSSSQPAIMASMLEGLDVRRGHRVLEVGAGTGYNAALLSRLVGPRGRVVSIDVEPETARGARRALRGTKPLPKVVVGDGRKGWEQGAPYDRIIVTASAATLTRQWLDQLADGGLIVLPLWVDSGGQSQVVVTLTKSAGRLRSVAVVPGAFMPLRDEAGGPPPPAGLYLSATESRADRFQPLAALTGEAIARLTPSQRRRLLALALSEPRSTALRMRVPRWSIGVYLALEAPRTLYVGGPNPGVIGRQGRGLAQLEGRRTFTRIHAYGPSEPERRLKELLGRWRDAGRPTVESLTVEARFGRSRQASLRWGWDARRPTGLRPE